jgi:hypothetical protein
LGAESVPTFTAEGVMAATYGPKPDGTAVQRVQFHFTASVSGDRFRIETSVSNNVNSTSETLTICDGTNCYAIHKLPSGAPSGITRSVVLTGDLRPKVADQPTVAAWLAFASAGFLRAGGRSPALRLEDMEEPYPEADMRYSVTLPTSEPKVASSAVARSSDYFHFWSNLGARATKRPLPASFGGGQ